MKVMDTVNKAFGNKSFFGDFIIKIRGGVLTHFYAGNTKNLNDYEEAQVTETVKIPIGTYQDITTTEEVKEK